MGVNYINMNTRGSTTQDKTLQTIKQNHKPKRTVPKHHRVRKTEQNIENQ